MGWAEVILIVIGIVFIGVSFYVTENLSQQDVDNISMMCEEDLRKISEKHVKELNDKIELTIEDILDEALIITQRGLDKETNNKIMAISEYSETVLESINKSHNEITFLYSMLNDKQVEAAQLVSDLQKLTKQIRDMNLDNAIANVENVTNNTVSYEKGFEPMYAPVVEIQEEQTVLNEVPYSQEYYYPYEEGAVLSKNEQILLLYREGKNEVEIAKALDCGLGEVRLVLGLYKNEA